MSASRLCTIPNWQDLFQWAPCCLQPRGRSRTEKHGSSEGRGVEQLCVAAAFNRALLPVQCSEISAGAALAAVSAGLHSGLWLLPCGPVLSATAVILGDAARHPLAAGQCSRSGPPYAGLNCTPRSALRRAGTRARTAWRPLARATVRGAEGSIGAPGFQAQKLSVPC